jgi:hypothetical protein
VLLMSDLMPRGTEQRTRERTEGPTSSQAEEQGPRAAGGVRSGRLRAATLELAAMWAAEIRGPRSRVPRRLAAFASVADSAPEQPHPLFFPPHLLELGAGLPDPARPPTRRPSPLAWTGHHPSRVVNAMHSCRSRGGDGMRRARTETGPRRERSGLRTCAGTAPPTFVGPATFPVLVPHPALKLMTPEKGAPRY